MGGKKIEDREAGMLREGDATLESGDTVMDKIIQVLVLLEKRTKTMETRLKRIEASVAETVNSKSGSAKITAGAPARARVKVLRCSMGWSLLMLCVLGVLLKAAILEVGLPEKAELFVRMGLHGSGVTGRIHSSIMDSSYNAIRDIFELA